MEVLYIYNYDSAQRHIQSQNRGHVGVFVGGLVLKVKQEKELYSKKAPAVLLRGG